MNVGTIFSHRGRRRSCHLCQPDRNGNIVLSETEHVQKDKHGATDVQDGKDPILSAFRVE